MKTRIYVVRNDDIEETFLVRAGSQAQAIKHVVKSYTARVVDQETLLRLRDEGVEVENASSAGNAAAP